jgi:2-dehydropantoate 2-reductase
LVVPLLNGLDHMTVLRERFGTRAVAGSIRIEAHRPAPGRIVHTSPFLAVELASSDPAREERLRSFAQVLERAGIPAEVLSSEVQVLWSKLVRLNALALTTSASGWPLGPIRSEPEWRAQLEGALAEGAAVGRAEGAEVSAQCALAELDEAHEALRSSMQRDIEAGREPELDAIAGSVLRAAARNGRGYPRPSSRTRWRRRAWPVPALGPACAGR